MQFCACQVGDSRVTWGILMLRARIVREHADVLQGNSAERGSLIADLCASFQDIATRHLTDKTSLALDETHAPRLVRASAMGARSQAELLTVSPGGLRRCCTE